ncbi:MAG: V-type ATP synthase subunit I [Clostridiales bacterium]|nr:V-type ATP synthase subunit I [Bacillota bacterium]NLL53944.1 V-type ATP synthase subunit I [Clostridiales bacterium]
MAIAEMKKLRLLALRKDKARLLKVMQKLGCVQVVEQADEAFPADTLSAQKLEELQKTIGRLDLAIARLSPYDMHKPGMLSLPPEAGEDQVTLAEAGRGDTMKVVERVEEIERTRGELRTRENRDRAQLEMLRPWEAMDVPLDKLGETRSALVWAITLPQKNLIAFEERIKALGPARIDPVSRVRDELNLLLAAHGSVREGVEELMREHGASIVRFEGVQGSAALNLDLLQGKLKRIEEVRAQLQQEVQQLAGHLPELRLLRDVEALERSRLEAGQRCIDTRSAFLMTGWVPAEKAEALKAALRKVSPECETEFLDPEEDEKPPTLLQNHRVVAPFETIVRMFSTPDPRGVDPSFVMMPFWVCFFGMMVSDAGYGVVLGLAAAFVWWRLGDRGLGKMAFILTMGGLSTVIWGSIYGGWFGTTPYKPVLDPMNDALKVLVLCVVVGFIHLVAGMCMSAYLSIKRGKPLEALFDQGFWLMILVGIPLILVNGTLGGIIAVIGALGVLCTAGRRKKGIVGKVLGGLGSLYGITGYLSDLLSYARLFGMGLATGVIGMVVNILAGLLWGAGPVGYVLAIAVLLGLHTFNLFINALGAYVHSCRLQFIEFFGKFYESGGRDFAPLREDTRYVMMSREK